MGHPKEIQRTRKMKKIRNAVMMIVMAIGSYHVLANSLDDYARFEAAKNIVANQSVFFCKGKKLSKDQVVKLSKVQFVDEIKVQVFTKLPNCHFNQVVSNYFYKSDKIKVVKVRSTRPLPKN